MPKNLHLSTGITTPMRICEALAERCDAVLMVGELRGACREVGMFETRGRPVYRAADEIPVGNDAST